MRCKVKFFARRLAGIATLYDKKWLGYGRLNLLTMVSKLSKNHARGAFLTEKTTKNVKISLSISFRLLKMYCDTFELSFDVRCKVQSLAQRLAGISALYDKKRLSYAHSKLLTMVSKLGKTQARGAYLTKKQQKM